MSLYCVIREAGPGFLAGGIVGSLTSPTTPHSRTGSPRRA